MEVYDSPGFGIGCWRSCGQQEWELISHEVILQLLFSCAHSLNTSNTSFSLLFVFALRVRILVLGRRTCVIFQRGKSGRWRASFPLPVCAMSMMTLCSWKWGINTLLDGGITFLKSPEPTGGVRGQDGEEARGASAEWHPRWEWWIINKGKGTVIGIRRRWSARCSSAVVAELSLQACCLRSGKPKGQSLRNGQRPGIFYFCLRRACLRACVC